MVKTPGFCFVRVRTLSKSAIGAAISACHSYYTRRRPRETGKLGHIDEIWRVEKKIQRENIPKHVQFFASYHTHATIAVTIGLEHCDIAGRFFRNIGQSVSSVVSVRSLSGQNLIGFKTPVLICETSMMGGKTPQKKALLCQSSLGSIYIYYIYVQHNV